MGEEDAVPRLFIFKELPYINPLLATNKGQLLSLACEHTLPFNFPAFYVQYPVITSSLSLMNNKRFLISYTFMNTHFSLKEERYGCIC